MGEYCVSHRNTRPHLPSLGEANVQRKTQRSHVSKAAGVHCLKLPTLQQVALIGFTHWVRKWAAKQMPVLVCVNLSCKYLKIFQLLKHLFCPGHKNRWRQSSKGLLHPSYSICSGDMLWFHSELNFTHAKCQGRSSSGLPCLVEGAVPRAGHPDVLALSPSCAVQPGLWAERALISVTAFVLCGFLTFFSSCWSQVLSTGDTIFGLDSVFINSHL